MLSRTATENAMPVMAITTGALNQSDRAPLIRLATAKVPPRCMGYIPETRPLIPSGTIDWMMVWVMVMNPAVLDPSNTAAPIDIPAVDEKPKSVCAK